MCRGYLGNNLYWVWCLSSSRNQLSPSSNSMVVQRLPHQIAFTKRQLDAALMKCYEGGVADGRAMVQDEKRNKNNEQKWRMIRQKYEKEPKNVRAKARRMNALKAKQGMKAMKAKARVVAMKAMNGR